MQKLVEKSIEQLRDLKFTCVSWVGGIGALEFTLSDGETCRNGDFWGHAESNFYL